MKKRLIFIITMTAVALLGLLVGCGQKEELTRMNEPTREAEVMHARVLDPTCGMEVDPETAISVEYQSHVYYFCSAQCRDSFLEDPGKYVSEEQMLEKGMPGGGDHMEVDPHRMGEDEEYPKMEEEHRGHGH